MLLNCNNGVSRSVNIWLVSRERGLACPRGHQWQPAARRRRPGQPRLRQSPRRHAAPRPHRRRRPARPPRPRRDHIASARRMAPRATVDKPLRSRHRTTRAGGLTSPDPVTAPPRPKAPGRRQPRSRRTRTSRRKVSGQKNMPELPLKISSSAQSPESDHPNSRGGSRLSDGDGPAERTPSRRYLKPGFGCLRCSRRGCFVCFSLRRGRVT
jgi:hypothetical protein